MYAWAVYATAWTDFGTRSLKAPTIVVRKSRIRQPHAPNSETLQLLPAGNMKHFAGQKVGFEQE